MKNLFIWVSSSHLAKDPARATRWISCHLSKATQTQTFHSLNSRARLVLEKNCALINVSVGLLFLHVMHSGEAKAFQPLKQEDALSPEECFTTQ